MNYFKNILVLLLISSTSFGSYVIPNGAVTTAKIAANAVTKPKIAALGQQVSSSSASFATSSSTFVAVTNLSISNFVTTGRPVFIAMIPDGSNPANIGLPGSATLSVINLDRGGTSVGQYAFTLSSAVDFGHPLVWIDAVSAGTYTYTVQAKTASGTNFGVTNYKLMVYELD